MKTLITILLLIYSVNSNAQHFYVSTGGDYNLPASKQLITTTSHVKIENHTGSFGEGSSFFTSLGYEISKHVSIEFSYSKLNSAKKDFSILSHFGNKKESYTTAKMNRIIPSLKLSAGNKIRIYTRFGMVIGMNPEIKTQARLIWSNGVVYSAEYNGEYSGGSSVGITGGLGADFFVGKRLYVLAEINAIAQSWGPERLTYDYIETSSTTYYNESGSMVLTDELSSNSAWMAADLKEYYPFNSVGLQVGVAYRFGKTE